MAIPTLSFRRTNTRIELALLLVASLACVTVLTVGIAGGSQGPAGFGLATVLLALLVGAAALAAGYLLLVTAAAMRRQQRAALTEATELKRSLSTAEALIKAEPQVLMFWEQGAGLNLITHTLTGVPGLPASHPELVRFSFWLDARSAANLKAALDLLLTDGRAFNLILRTATGGHIEADGRAAGGRAVLRFKDVAGYKRDLSAILDQHSNFARDIRASRALLNALPHPAWLRDQDGRLSWVNKAYVRAVEMPSEADVLKGQIELLESRQRKLVQRALKMNRPFNERLPLIVAGERKAHEVIIIPLGEATAGAAIDVAAIESVQGELERQIQAYDRTLHRVATAVAIFNPEQRLVFFNEAYRKLWQLDGQWLDTGPSDGVVLDRLRELGSLPEVVNYREWKQKLLACYKTGTGHEDWWHLPDGRMLHVIAEQRPDGGVTYLYADETERVALESRYNALIDVQRETLNSLKEGVAVFATDGRLQLYNSAFAAIWKLSRRRLDERPHVEEFLGNAGVLFDDPRTWARIGHAVTSIAEQREAIDGQMLRPDQSVIDYAAMPLPDGGTLLTFADVTDAKRYERALVERNEALVTADKLKSQFIGHVSYELRTPLTNIIGFGEMLATPSFGTLTAKQREYLDDIAASSRTLLSIINTILDLATIDAGVLELKLTLVDVRSVIEQAIQGVRERAAHARLTLDIAVADDAGSFIADEERVRQVLYNLLSNAVGFSKPEGVVHVSCWREDGELVFSVEDQGVGIPKEQLERVFDRFEARSHGSRHRGAGLGLSIVKSLVAIHGGSVALESEPGRGTRVTVRFPERGAQSLPQPQPESPDASRMVGS